VGTGEFDVFLSHRSEDDVAVERIARKLRAASLEPSIDNWYCQGGGRWQQEIADGLMRSKACAVFFGASGVSDWVDEEIEISLSRTKKDRSFRVFLVLLPGAPEPFDRSKAPAFLNNRGWVDLRKGFEQPSQFTKLANAILGISAVPAPASVVSKVSPYRGLEVFDEDHAQYYFGRSTDVQNLLERLKTSRVLAVIGPSGSGKSSLVRAGLIPALRDGRLPGSEYWIIAKLRPGRTRWIVWRRSSCAPRRPAHGQTIDELARDSRTLDHVARLIAGDAPATTDSFWSSISSKSCSRCVPMRRSAPRSSAPCCTRPPTRGARASSCSPCALTSMFAVRNIRSSLRSYPVSKP